MTEDQYDRLKEAILVKGFRKFEALTNAAHNLRPGWHDPVELVGWLYANHPAVANTIEREFAAETAKQTLARNKLVNVPKEMVQETAAQLGLDRCSRKLPPPKPKRSRNRNRSSTGPA